MLISNLALCSGCLLLQTEAGNANQRRYVTLCSCLPACCFHQLVPPCLKHAEMGATHLSLLKPYVATTANEQPSIDACYWQKQAMPLITVNGVLPTMRLLVAFTSWYRLIRNMQKWLRMQSAKDP